MDSAQAGRTGGGAHRVADAAPTHPGRTVVRERVLVRVAEEATADALRVQRGHLSVEVSEARGGMALTISTPLPVPELDDIDAIQQGTPVLERVQAIQNQLRDRITQLTGRDVTRVNMTITGAVIAAKRRVL
ncbi:hypothetical protein [Microterricola viridarii]|uniref:hypothetical protein n=1 Tax=Microterricola viridarii TaxID=412690 RepID=UPI0009E80BA0|nr:hypothetical protein [Microterricola viridarii]